MTKLTIRSGFISTLAILSLTGCSGGADTSPTDIPEPGSASLALSAPPPAAATAKNDGAHGCDGHGKGGAAFLERFDKNGDGKIELSELPAGMQEKLAAADTNKDGVLSTEELAAHRAEMWKEHHDPAAMIKRLDKNGDGKLEVTELAGLPAPRVERLTKADTNKDGVLSVSEIEAGRAAAQKEHFARKDKNGDGALTADEVGPRRWEHLKVADADGNGSVTLAEMDQAILAGTLRMPHRGFHHRWHDGDERGQGGSFQGEPVAPAPQKS